MAEIHQQRIGKHDRCQFTGMVDELDGMWWCPVCAKLFWEGTQQ